MIKNKKDLLDYLEADYLCAHKPSKRSLTAVVNKDILKVGTTWGGIPAKKISDNGFYDP